MKLVRSVCTNMAFPESRKSLDEFRRMAEFLAAKGVKSLEFYHDGPDAAKVGNVLSDLGLEGVWIGVIPSKEKKVSLCSEDGWKKAAEYYDLLGNMAAVNGIGTMMLNSGWISPNPEAQLSVLAQSIEYLHNQNDKKGRKLKFVLEPGDSWMASCQLLGPYQRVKAFCERMDQAGTPLYLTMDSAHSAEEGENFVEAVEAVKKYCDHIHFANCFIRDKASEWYGDQHVGFDWPDTEWTPATLEMLFGELGRIYPGDEPLKVALEYMCREADPYACFDKHWASMPFLH